MNRTMIRQKFPHLFQFFAGYFHQDWELDDPDPQTVIDRFLQETKLTLVEDTLVELSQLLAMNLAETELQQILLYDLSCNYDPSVDSYSHQVWLELLQNILKQYLQKLILAV